MTKTNVLRGLVVLVLLALLLVYSAGRGWLGSRLAVTAPSSSPIPEEVLTEYRTSQMGAAQLSAAHLTTPPDKQILFGDLHVHTTISMDAFLMSLPGAGGDGAHPISEACDFARYCSALDFWSINDHAMAITPDRWEETVSSIRQCNAVTDPETPDVVAYLGWEWTQRGSSVNNHYGHKNVIFKGTADDQIPTRPIASLPEPDATPLLLNLPPTLLVGARILTNISAGGLQTGKYFDVFRGIDICRTGVAVRDLPPDCMEYAATPAQLFAKLDDWGSESLVIPHGTTWGIYTPPGSSWDKQLLNQNHDPNRQILMEVYSGHGNSEEFRNFDEVIFKPDGTRSCPQPSDNYLPACWQAGEIIRGRCSEAGLAATECEARAEEARQYAVDTRGNALKKVVPGQMPADWLDAGQCRDCFQPAFNYRPKSSAQYVLALNQPNNTNEPSRFRFGFMASSDNHTARPGTGYKEYARTEMTENRLGYLPAVALAATGSNEEPLPRSQSFDATGVSPVITYEWERASSFFLTGGLVAVHGVGKNRDQIWDALQRREVYGTSGPRILLWFDLQNPPDTDGSLPMGSSVSMLEAPSFEVRAVGSRMQKPGCPDYSVNSLSPSQLSRLCRGECYNPSDARRPIDRIEVVRILPQDDRSENIADLIEDPWKVFFCDGSENGCSVTFSDNEFTRGARDAVYYVRAIESPSQAVAVDPLDCEIDVDGNCTRIIAACGDKPNSDDCKSSTQQRAWSSPIFVDYAKVGLSP